MEVQVGRIAVREPEPDMTSASSIAPRPRARTARAGAELGTRLGRVLSAGYHLGARESTARKIALAGQR